MTLPPIDASGENIVSFTGTKRPEPTDAFLQPVPHAKCQHYFGPFEVDVSASKCKCLSCGEEVSSMFVLEKLMRQESQWMQTHARYQDEMKRLAERSRTVCKNCGQMTRISRS